MFPRSILLCICLLLLLIVTSGCTSHTGSSAVPAQPAVNATAVQKVEVIHFHGNRQCTSCVAVGELANETVHEYFPAELATGRVTFQSINYDDPANDEIVKEYQVTGSSLWITVKDATGSHKQQNLDVWSLTNDQDQYKVYLSAIIAKRLNGDLS